MKLLFIIFILLFMVGCNTNTRNPAINNDNFDDYVPWWATNKTQTVTNMVESGGVRLCIF